MATQTDIAVLFDELSRHGAVISEHLPRTKSSSGRGRGIERRASKRHLTTGEGTLHWTNSFGERGTCTIQARDMNDSGMQLESATRVPFPSVVRLFGRTLECLGYVRYCREEGEKFILGIEIAGEPYPCRNGWKS